MRIKINSFKLVSTWFCPTLQTYIYYNTMNWFNYVNDLLSGANLTLENT